MQLAQLAGNAGARVIALAGPDELLALTHAAAAHATNEARTTIGKTLLRTRRAGGS